MCDINARWAVDPKASAGSLTTVIWALSAAADPLGVALGRVIPPAIAASRMTPQIAKQGPADELLQ
jgi:hypothetical protein